VTPERWSWLGEPLAIDFANTVRRRGDAYEELLRTPADLAEWAAHQRGRIPDLPPVSEERLGAARALRDAVFAALLAAAQAEPVPAAAEGALNAALAAVALIPRLEAGRVVSVPLAPADPLDELFARACASALELLSEPDLALCDAPGCGQFFLRHRSDQRWCGSACGVRARVARHAASRSQAVHSASSTASSGTSGARTQ
jgi:Putative stress-induced transcription regulator/CGNR zinc finger